MQFRKICIIILTMLTILFTVNEVFAANVQTEITTTKQEIQAKKEEITTIKFKLNNF